MDNKINRKEFLKRSAFAGAGLSMMSFNIIKPKDDQKVRIGFIGVGGRGTSHLKGLIRRSDVEVPAVCDIKPEAAKNARSIVAEAGLDSPNIYTRGETDYERMLEKENMDGVIISTPWLWHVPMAVNTMKAGMYVGLEVPAAITVDGCWELVKTSEETGMPCMLLENACYNPRVLAILNMVRQGLFGELIHARCGYFHNLFHALLDENVEFGPGTTASESEWRTQHHINRNGDLYPTHGIGPVAHWFDINRGNKFHTITSTATKARGLHKNIVERGGINHPNAKINFKKGDVVTSTITTANGESVIVTHDTTLPRPKTWGYWCQGTKGIWMTNNDNFNGENKIPSIYIEGMSPEYDEWEPFQKYLDKYKPNIIKKFEKDAAGSSHGGRDFFIRNAFVVSIKNQSQPPIDVYDAAAWSVIGPLSEESIAQGGHPVEFPDFTNGKWITYERIFKPEETDY